MFKKNNNSHTGLSISDPNDDRRFVKIAYLRDVILDHTIINSVTVIITSFYLYIIM